VGIVLLRGIGIEEVGKEIWILGGEGGSLHLHFFNDTRVCIIAASELVEWRLSRLAFISYELKLNVLF